MAGRSRTGPCEEAHPHTAPFADQDSLGRPPVSVTVSVYDPDGPETVTDVRPVPPAAPPIFVVTDPLPDPFAVSVTAWLQLIVTE